MYYVYVLQSEVDGNFYVGYTKDLKLRFEKHNKGYVASTKNRRPLKLIYYEACLNQQDATHWCYFNACGADPDCELGECHNPETHLIPLVLQAASGRREAITIFGRDYPTPDGTCIRDYIHIEDLCSAHGLALDTLLSKRLSGALAYNLGNGKGFSVKESVVQKNIKD